MATIIEGPWWTLTDKAAELLESEGIIKKCEHEHVDTIPMDFPIYHIDSKSPRDVGQSTIYAYIQNAEKRVEK